MHLIQYFNGERKEQYKGARNKGQEEWRVKGDTKETIPS
jgi:hypothetical protein